MAVTTPDDNPPDGFIDMMRIEWEARTSTGEELEFWKFVKTAMDYANYDDWLNEPDSY